ncbi:hypothetical protein K1719_017362 [Acacia pycnantha]|nr:hypothetical protein K1719_017362 [Acacia pycnantha]
MEEELEKMKEAAKSDPSTTVQALDPPPRYKKWKAVRIKDGKYINANVETKIDELKAQSSQVSFTSSTRMDILSTAIGKSDNLDHVQGEPRGVSVAKYFGRRRRCSHDDDNPSPKLVARIRAELQDDIFRQLCGELKAMVEENEHLKCIAHERLNTLSGRGDHQFHNRLFQNTVFNAKQLIGRRLSNPYVQNDMKLWPFKVTPGAGDPTSNLLKDLGLMIFPIQNFPTD